MAWSQISCVGFLMIACAMAQTEPVAGRKNVLMLIADDMRPNIGVYEDANEAYFNSPTMVTPNLDALAAKSLVLTRAYTQGPNSIETFLA